MSKNRHFPLSYDTACKGEGGDGGDNSKTGEKSVLPTCHSEANPKNLNKAVIASFSDEAILF